MSYHLALGVMWQKSTGVRVYLYDPLSRKALGLAVRGAPAPGPAPLVWARCGASGQPRILKFAQTLTFIVLKSFSHISTQVAKRCQTFKDMTCFSSIPAALQSIGPTDLYIRVAIVGCQYLLD